MISIFQPVSLAASRTFCPLRPMASESWLSATTTSADFFSSSKPTFSITAGFKASAMKTRESCVHAMMSIFSPRSSRTTAWTREPFIPTQAPTGSTARSREATAFLAENDAVDEVALASRILPLDDFPFGLADFLEDHLLGRLRRDPAEVLDLDDGADLVPEFGLAVDLASLLQGDLGLGVGHLVDDLLQGDGLDFPTLAINPHLDVFGRPVFLLRGGEQRGLHRLEDASRVDSFFPPDLFDHCKKLSTHHPAPSLSEFHFQPCFQNLGQRERHRCPLTDALGLRV